MLLINLHSGIGTLCIQFAEGSQFFNVLFTLKFLFFFLTFSFFQFVLISSFTVPFFLIFPYIFNFSFFPCLILPDLSPKISLWKVSRGGTLPPCSHPPPVTTLLVNPDLLFFPSSLLLF